MSDLPGFCVQTLHLSQLLFIQQSLNIDLVQVTSPGSVCWEVLGRRGRRGDFTNQSISLTCRIKEQLCLLRRFPESSGLEVEIYITKFLKELQILLNCSNIFFLNRFFSCCVFILALEVVKKLLLFAWFGH